MPNENTAYLNLPLPHPDNLLEGDVFRLRDALTGLDAHARDNDTWHDAAALEATDTRNAVATLSTRADTLESGKVDATDPRLTDARPPTAHAASHKTGGKDALKAADIGGVTPEQLPKIDGASLVLDGGVWKVSEAWLAQKAPQPAPVFSIGEFKDWFEQNPPKGWLVRNGAVLANAHTAYPELWEYLHKPENAWKCKTLAQWNALSSAAGGAGGVPFFVVDDAAKTIKLPDTRGDYARCAGSSYLQAVGGWHLDAIRNISGALHGAFLARGAWAEACFEVQGAAGPYGPTNGGDQFGAFDFSAHRQVPVASDNRTRSYGLLGCVYVGSPT